MELQKTFRESYMKTLRDAVKSEDNIALYGEDSFDLDKSQIKRLANVYAPENLESKMDGLETDDFKAAIVVYEGFKEISPLLASNEAFWAYICHTSLFRYAQKRWPKVLTNEASSNYILDHWFFNQSILRNAGASLWWSVYNTLDEERGNPYELTEVFFKNYSLRVMYFGSYQLIRHREAMLGILGFIKSHYEEFQGTMEVKMYFISKYFNRLGAVKQLSYMDREFFRATCEKLLPKLHSITNRDQVINDESLYSILL